MGLEKTRREKKKETNKDDQAARARPYHIGYCLHKLKEVKIRYSVRMSLRQAFRPTGATTVLYVGSPAYNYYDTIVAGIYKLP